MPRSRKKGVCLTPQHEKADQLNVSWVYNWTLYPWGNAAQFVPMVWGKPDVNRVNLRQHCQQYPALLGFNEPDHKGGAVMPPREAISLWPKLVEAGVPLGSPCPAHEIDGQTTWLREFMQLAGQRGLRVDFMCIHWYGDCSKGKEGADDLVSALWQIYQRYNKPIWLTEFGAVEWPWNQNHPLTEEHTISFLEGILPKLESLPFVERYAWFGTRGVFGGFGPEWTMCSLFTGDGKLTEIGKAYRDLA